MKIVPVKPEMTSIPLGRQGENLRTQIVFPVQEWLEEYPEAVIGLINRRPDENTEYPVQISGIEDGTVKWTVGAAELANHGNGECTLIAIEDEVVVKSKNYHTVVFRSLSGEGDAPDPWASWVEYFIEKADTAEEAAETAVSAKEAAEDARDAAQAAAGDFQGLTATVQGLPERTDPQVNVTHSQGGLYNLAFKIPKGDRGDPAPAELVVPAVEDWLDDHLDPLTADTPLDRSLSVRNAAAPADMTGDVRRAVRTEANIAILDNWQIGYFYNVGSGTTSADISSPTANQGYVAQYAECEEGDIFSYSGTDNNSARAGVFLSAASGENNVLEYMATRLEYAERRIMIAPKDAKYILSNSRVGVNYSLRKLVSRHQLMPGADVDELIMPGTYYCPNAATAATIQNIPDGILTGFMLDVFPMRAQEDYFCQRLTTTTIYGHQFKIYERVFTTEFGEWREILTHANSIYLDIKKLTEIEENADLDDITDYGSYYSPNATRTATLKNVPFFSDSGFSLYVVNSQTPNSGANYVRQFIFANKKELSTVYTRTKNLEWGNWQIMATGEMIEKPLIVHESTYEPGARNRSPEKMRIRVATSNVAHYWLQGKAEIEYMADDPLNIPKWRRWLMKADADILFLQECEDYLDEDREINAFDMLYKPFYDEDTNIDTGESGDITSPARRKILNRMGLDTNSQLREVETLTPLTYEKNGYYNWCTVAIPNVGSVLLVSVHNFAGSSADRIADRKNYLDDLASFIQSKNTDYFILAGDFNTRVPESDYPNLMDFCETLNAKPANGGMLGWFSTIHTEEAERAYDNIIVSGNIDFEMIDCDPLMVMSKAIHTDHIPVIAEISFK